MIMLSNATYTAYDPGQCRRLVARDREHAAPRDDLGFTGVTITDSLDGTAHARGRPRHAPRHRGPARPART